MGRMITKTNDILQRLLKQKGQGLTEFVLVLAFCAVIGWIASEVGFMDAIGAVFDSGKRPETVTAAIGGGKSSVTPTPDPDPDPNPDPNPNPNPNPNPDVTYNEFDWGTIDPNLYYKKEYKDEHASRDGGNTTIDFTVDSGKEDRLITDQVALANLATYFIGKTQYDVKNMLKHDKNDNEQTADMGKDNNGENVVLGHLIPLRDKNKKAIQGIRLSTTMNDDNLKPEYQYEIFKWMKNPTNPESVTVDENGNYMYMVSDYIVSQGWTDKSGSNQANGIHLRLEYDYSEQFGTYGSLDEVKVVGVHIAIDPGSQNNKQKIASSNGQSSSGLDVYVRKISETENQVIFKDTGDARDINGNYEGRKVIKKDGTEGTVNGGKTSGLYNWHHETYRDLVIQFLTDFWVVDTIPSGSGFVEKPYTQGDILKIGSNFYVVTETGTQKINMSKTGDQTYLEANGPLVKITGQLTAGPYNEKANFIHENDLKTFHTDTYFQYRGFVVTLSNGDVYVYAGPKETSYKITAEFVSNSPLFIKVGNVNDN